MPLYQELYVQLTAGQCTVQVFGSSAGTHLHTNTEALHIVAIRVFFECALGEHPGVYGAHLPGQEADHRQLQVGLCQSPPACMWISREVHILAGVFVVWVKA
jgi:hypothetical protein